MCSPLIRACADCRVVSKMADFERESEDDFLSSFCRYADEIDTTELREGRRNVCGSCG